MLVLSRRQNEVILIAGDISVTVLAVVGNRVQLGIRAPKDVRILRSELSDVCRTEESMVRPANETSLGNSNEEASNQHRRS